MDLIEKELVKINFVVDQYLDEQQIVYETQTKAITDKLKKIIDELAPAHLLISANSVRKVKHYSFSSRVKEGESLKEKLIRNNLCNKFFPLLADDFNIHDGVLINQIKQRLLDIDDLIGVKILTDLNVDCKKMFELVASPEFKARATAQNITLSDDDLKKQPQQMKNGLDIYKIKGKYDRYNFELQIKSKIISAWGDMEHSIFYKDYYVSPVRDSTQSSMNHVGKLLFDMDDFLESIRNANKLYKQNAEVLTFLEWFDDNYNVRVSEKIGNVGFKIDGISELLYAVYKRQGITDNFVNRTLRFEHFELQTNDPLLGAYVSKRNEVYDLKILESIVLSWLLEDNQIIDDENLEQALRNYIEVLQKSTADFLSKKNYGFDTGEILELLVELYETGFECNCNEKFLLSLNSLYHFFEIRAYIYDIADGVVEGDYITALLKMVFIFLNKGDTNRMIEKLSAEDAVDKEELKKSFILLRDKITEKAKNYKVDLNKTCEAIIETIN